MIQVLQIVKELVTPSRHKAATVKAGRDMSEQTVRALDGVGAVYKCGAQAP